MKYIDNFLNGITMYKLVLYGLMTLSVLAVIMSVFGLVSFNPLSFVYSFFTITIVSYISNELFAKIFKVQTNVESSSITAFILFLIAFPIQNLTDFKVTILLCLVAMASKYLLVINKQHIFNPAAVGLLIMGVLGYGVGAWWVGSAVLLLPTLVLGFLVLRKVKRFTLFFAFLLASLISFSISSVLNGGEIISSLKELFLSWPVIFLGTIMLTEPLTTPPKLNSQIVYGVIVGLIFGSQFNLGSFYVTPEFALVIGNIYSYIVSPKYKLKLTLVQKNQLTADVYDFVFKSDEKIDFIPGQYLEWTLGHSNPDVRGNRRYFTIASSPTEENIILGTKFYSNPSTFKQKLLSMSPGDSMSATCLNGEFNMPTDKSKKLVFLAGGIGVTPFRSMAMDMINKSEKRDIVFFYSNKTLADAAYKEIFDKAMQGNGWRNIYVVNELSNDALQSNMRVGFITKEMIVNEVADYKDRVFMISGTHGMVTAFEKTLTELGVSKANIKTDFFPGFV